MHPDSFRRSKQLAFMALGGVASLEVALEIFEASHLPILSQDAMVIAFASLSVGLVVAILFRLSVTLTNRLTGWQTRSVGVTALVVLVCGIIVLVAVTALNLAVGLDLTRRYAGLSVLLVGLSLSFGCPADGRPGRFLLWSLAATSTALIASISSGNLSLHMPPPTTNGSVPIDDAPARKILLLAVDGLGWETLQRWQQDQGNDDFEWFLQRGYVGPLATLLPTDSPRIWATIATGMSPREHKILFFNAWDIPGMQRALAVNPRFEETFWWVHWLRWSGFAELRPVANTDLGRPAFWEIIDDERWPITLAGWWATWPASHVNGRLISDRFHLWDFPVRPGAGTVSARQITWPPNLEAEVADFRRFTHDFTAERLRAFVNVPASEIGSQLLGGESEILQQLRLALAHDETYFALAEFLVDSDAHHGLYVFYFRGIDTVSHAAMTLSNLYPEVPVPVPDRERYSELISRYYAFTMAGLRRVIEAAGADATVLIVSDHGFQQYRPGSFGHAAAPTGVIMAIDGRTASGIHGAFEANVYDVVPTILWLAGYRVAEDMSGRPLVELFPRARATGNPGSRIPTYGSRQHNPEPLTWGEQTR